MIPRIICAKNIDLQEKIVGECASEFSVPKHYIFHIKPEKTEILIEQVRDLQKITSFSSVSIKIFALYSFDQSSLEVQNSMLKTLEEKNENNLFIMFCSRPDKILPTIRSRSVIYESEKTADSNLSQAESLVNEIRKSNDYSFMASPILQKPTRESVAAIIDDCVYYLRKEMVGGQYRNAQIIKECIAKKELLVNNNLNPSLAVDSLFIQIKKHFSS